jgi:O-antigen/teichoic acid export membrane protein
MASQALAAWAVLPLGIVLASRKTPFRLRLRLPVLREMLAFSAPLVLSGAAVYANGYADRWLVKAWLGLDELGVYAAGYRIASMVAVALAGFQLAVTPLVYHHYREPGTPAFLKKAFEYFLAVALPAVVVIAALAPELVALLAGPAFAPAADVVGWLALGVALMNAYVFAPGLSLAKLTGRIAALNAAAGAVNIALAAALLPVLGRAGAALAFLAGAATMAGLYFRLGQPHYPVPHRGLRDAAAIAAAAGLVGLFSAASLPLAWRLALGLVAAAALAGMVIERPWSARQEALT